MNPRRPERRDIENGPGNDLPIDTEWPPGFGGGIVDWPDSTPDLIDEPRIGIENRRPIAREPVHLPETDLPPLGDAA